MGANFRLWLKKSPRLSHTKARGSKAQLRSRSLSHVLRCRCVWVGQRFGGFLDLCEVFFLINTRGCLTSAGRVFYLCGNNDGFLAFLTPLQFNVSFVAFMKFKCVHRFLQCIKFPFEPYGLQDIHYKTSSFYFPSFF
jgi:hypothetical protein